jgi:hypothetical protein
LDEEGTDQESVVAESSGEGGNADESTSAIATQLSSPVARPAARNPLSEDEVSSTAPLALAAEIREEDDEPYDRKTEKLSQSSKTPQSKE